MGNLGGLDTFVATNTIRRAPASLFSDARSLAELKKVFTGFRTTFPNTKVTIDKAFFLEGRSFAKWTLTGTNTSPLFPRRLYVTNVVVAATLSGCFTLPRGTESFAKQIFRKQRHNGVTREKRANRVAAVKI